MTFKNLAIALMSVISCLSASAENNFFIEDFSIEAGETKELEILLTNDVAFCAFQADIYIPKGLTVYQEDDEYIFDLSSRKYRDHTLSAALQEDNAIRLLSYSTKVRNYSGNEGVLVYFTVTADENFCGTHQIEIKNIVFTQADETEYKFESSVTVVTGPATKVPNDDIPITICDSEHGQVTLFTTVGNSVKFTVKAFENWKVNSVVVNGVDVISDIDGSFTTEAITEATTINISYEENISMIDETCSSNVKVYGYNNNIFISGVEIGKYISVYDVNGIFKKIIETTNDFQIITLEEGKVYIVKYEGKTYKVRL